ncbi:MAG: hypothetical protein B7Y84_11995, partial [Azorhizobium sp. 32-67-21]
AGDVVRKAGLRYRIDRVEGAEAQLLEAVRVEPGVYQPSDSDGEAITARNFVPPVPVTPVFLDLPLLTGEEVPYAPHVAVAAEPWPGSVAVWSSSQDQGYEVNRLIAGSAVIGVTEAPLLRASPGVWDRGAPLRIRISDGELASADTLAVLNGANAMAIGDGSAANWEVFQFADAQIVAPDTYELSTRLRGQLGTDAVMPEVWPVGSTVVLLDLALSQIDLPLSARGLARYYRIGIAARGLDDPNVTTLVEAFDGVGLRLGPGNHDVLRDRFGSRRRQGFFSPYLFGPYLFYLHRRRDDVGRECVGQIPDRGGALIAIARRSRHGRGDRCRRHVR